jgi:hypothetical protein
VRCCWCSLTLRSRLIHMSDARVQALFVAWLCRLGACLSAGLVEVAFSVCQQTVGWPGQTVATSGSVTTGGLLCGILHCWALLWALC